MAQSLEKGFVFSVKDCAGSGLSFLAEAALGWPGVGLGWRVGIGELAGFGRWSQDIAGSGSVFFSDENFEAGAGPGEVFAHAADGIGLDHGGNAGVFQRAFGEVGFGAAAVGLDDDELGVLHGGIICPDGRERAVPAAKNLSLKKMAFRGKLSA